MDCRVKPCNDDGCGDHLKSRDLSFRLQRSGRPEPSNHWIFRIPFINGDTEYWFPVLPLAQQTGMTNRGNSFASRPGVARNYCVFSET